MVTSLHREIERSINIDIESSSRDDDVTVITNLSSVEASYTVVQGKDSPQQLQDEQWRVNFCTLTTHLLHKRWTHAELEQLGGGIEITRSSSLLAANCNFYSGICILLEIIFHIQLFFSPLPLSWNKIASIHV